MKRIFIFIAILLLSRDVLATESGSKLAKDLYDLSLQSATAGDMSSAGRSITLSRLLDANDQKIAARYYKEISRSNGKNNDELPQIDLDRSILNGEAWEKIAIKSEIEELVSSNKLDEARMKIDSVREKYPDIVPSNYLETMNSGPSNPEISKNAEEATVIWNEYKSAALKGDLILARKKLSELRTIDAGYKDLLEEGSKLTTKIEEKLRPEVEELKRKLDTIKKNEHSRERLDLLTVLLSNIATLSEKYGDIPSLEETHNLIMREKTNTERIMEALKDAH